MSDPLDLTDPDALDGEDLGKALLTATLRDLLKKVRSGEATAADLNVARAACKDQGIQMRKTKTNALGGLAGALTDTLPFAGGDLQLVHSK